MKELLVETNYDRLPVSQTEIGIVYTLEKQLRRTLPLIHYLSWNSIGVHITNKQIQGLGLYHQVLTALPTCLTDLVCLQELYLHDNYLTEFISRMEELVNLEILDISCNKIQVLPSGISALTKLRTLNVQYNDLSMLPASIGNMSALQEFFLTGN